MDTLIATIPDELMSANALDPFVDWLADFDGTAADKAYLASHWQNHNNTILSPDAWSQILATAQTDTAAGDNGSS